MNSSDILPFFSQDENVKQLSNELREKQGSAVHLENLSGSAPSFIASAILRNSQCMHLFILDDPEAAIYFFNDLENLLPNKTVMYYPAFEGGRKKDTDSSALLRKTQILNAVSKNKEIIIVAPASALCEKVAGSDAIIHNTVELSAGDTLTMDFVIDVLTQYNFTRTDFVTAPGQYSRRGGIIDIFSLSDECPYRLEFSGDTIESVRVFDASSQLSAGDVKKISIAPNIKDALYKNSAQSLLKYLTDSAPTMLWIRHYSLAVNALKQEYARLEKEEMMSVEALFPADAFEEECRNITRVLWGNLPDKDMRKITFSTTPQKSFGKNFTLFFNEISDNIKNGYRSYIFTDTEQQVKRLSDIFAEIKSEYAFNIEDALIPVFLPIHEGFIAHRTKLACYTDHELFGRYHRFKLHDTFYKSKEALTLKELQALKPGDYVTHIDHGIGRFAGLEKVKVNGNEQEAVRIMYKDNDLLYVSIHSLHRITRYTGKEGFAPTLDKLGSASWKALKQKTGRKIKQLAFDLVKVYAERKARSGFAFAPDTYLQTELEASFIYEDTPDQIKATADTKKDMESPHPMDRLICGDVGFGKTEIAIRAAYKAVADSKQVAVLVPTTILALQHYHTFNERFKEFPCRVEYLNRFRTAKEKKEVLKKLAAGQVDIIIGTHLLANKEVIFKNLGLLIIDEEQKFGVGVKDKIKTLRSAIDILTLTATPIPRTLQFSLLGVRDLSVINTPPPNRYPIQTEWCAYNSNTIAHALKYELARGGQVFVIHNRIYNIQEVAETIKKLCPDAKVAVAHGQLKGHELESVMLKFIEGETDVLVSTAIVESGLDIPNLNTIIINDAQLFGLSDLHQLRGRVGRSNKKAFCYLVTPPFEALTREAQKKLEVIEQFSDLGSGFNIAMRDLDIRGAGNLLGGEQSGFINDMGIDMYYKILNEAVEEVKEELNEETLQAQPEVQHGMPAKKYAKDCQIETDAETMIPDDYVQNADERLRLYRQLNEAKNDEQVAMFENEMRDRFGALPDKVQRLTDIVRLRLLAVYLGMERIVFKNETLICFFVSQKDSPFYTSPVFANIVDYITMHPRTCRITDNTEKLSLTVSPVPSIADVLKISREINREK